MVSAMEQVGQEEVRDDAVSPIGDFIALVGGFMAALFSFPGVLIWYTKAENAIGKSLKGASPENPLAVVCFVVGIAVFAFAIVVLIGRFINPNFRLMRSPGWVYATGATILFLAGIVALVVPPNIGMMKASVSAGPILVLFSAITVAVGGMLKF